MGHIYYINIGPSPPNVSVSCNIHFLRYLEGLLDHL